MYKEMIHKMIDLLEKQHIDCYFNVTKEELNNYIEKLLKTYKLNDKYDFYYVTNVIIKKMFDRFDSHTKLIYKQYEFIPIRYKYIDRKLYIIRTDENNKDILYGQVLKIDNIEIEKLIEEIKNMTAYSTEEYLVFPIEINLCNVNALKSLPSVNSNKEKFEFEILKDNKIIKRSLTKSNNKLLEVNKPKSNYTYQVLDDIIYIVYNACTEEYENQMVEFVEKIKQTTKINNISKYIIDIRRNTGGNSSIIKPLIEYLKDKEVITLVDEYVFSAGRMAVVDLYNIGSKFVGTGIGTDLNCFGNVNRYEFKGFIFPISYKYFYFYKDNNRYIGLGVTGKNEFNEFKNHFDNQKYFIPNIFKPDYYIENTLEDYIYSTDSQLEFALSIMKNEKEISNENNRRPR